MSYGHQGPSGGYGTGGYGPPPGGYGQGPGYGQVPPAGGPPKNYMVHNILGILSCTVIGIIGLIFSLQVSSKWEMGDYAGAESAAKTAKIMGIIGLVSFILMIVFVVLYILFFVVLVGLMATAPTTTY
ncbi:CD225/dispanin family protein [Nocardiopsis sp. NRRL B-16309]|uniref:CD225/dispanin family protein n=1 Tax=Nocardiopsis sp. NRRL B-16309 TaxID=1519494 RepID=UPI0006AD9DE8|nr:CD225/dispanin family protein [Nocardiopsis sp. NRRL B-16309]KOX07231.1 Interferon-induced transmembrane protein [Nocardiopsis sp. NRRL B-16309]